MPKIWQNLKNMNDPLTEWLSNMDPRDASASKNPPWYIFFVTLHVPATSVTEMKIARKGHRPGPFHTSLTKMQGTSSFSWYSSASQTKKDTSKIRISWMFTTSHKSRKVKVIIFVVNFQALGSWPLVAIFDIPFKWPCPTSQWLLKN